MTSKKVQTLSEQLLQRGRTPASSAVAVLPVSEIVMVLTLDQLRPNPDNPRTTRNPKYNEIKASIRARGLDSVPKVTKDPDSAEDVYIFSDGGNTRYTILLELWEETRDERFRRIQCIFKPWPGRLKCLIGHLAENDVRGDLFFIEKALGIAKAKSIYEEQIGKMISQRELESLLRSEGYPVSQSSISRMEYTLENLYPYMPRLFKSGIGRPQIAQLITLRSAAQKAWDTFSANYTVSNSFEQVFGEVCRSLDDPDHYTLEMFKDELIASLLQAMPSSEIIYDRWLIELDPNEQNRRKLFGEPVPLPQHIINADKIPESTYAEKKAEPTNHAVTPSLSFDVPPNDGSKSKEKLPGVNRQSDTVISLQDASGFALADTDSGSQQQHGNPVRKEEEQLDLYGSGSDTREEPRESTLPESFPLASDIEQTGQHDKEPYSVLHSAVTESSVSFANTGLEPVTDIWHISALQDDLEHLQDASFRLAFELAEVLQAEQELCEDSTLTSAGYRVQVNIHQASPITRLLAMLAGDAAVSLSATELTNIVFGTEQPADWPLLDDFQTVKFLRLIRVIRRLREIQRQCRDGEVQG